MYALPHLKRSGGQIVVVDSVGGFIPYPRQSLYNVSNASDLMLPESWLALTCVQMRASWMLPVPSVFDDLSTFQSPSKGVYCLSL